MQSVVREAFEEGYKAGIKVIKPTDNEFHEDHKTPKEYGEGDLGLVLSGRFTFQGAKRKFKKYYADNGMDWPDEVMEEKDWADKHISRINISYELRDGGMTDGEPSYYLRSDRAGIYDAWLMEYEI